MNNIQGPPTNINGTTATGTTESSTSMNNITSAASAPSSVPLPLPSPGQSSNDIRTYLESNPQQKKRMQTIETFIQSKEPHTKKQQSSSSDNINNSASDSHSPTPSTSTSVPPDTDTDIASSKISAKIPDVTEDMAVQAYHDYIVQYYQDMAKKAGSNFSMGALKQPPRNSAQQATYNEFLQLLVENIEYLIANNIVLVPGSEAFNNINPAPFSIDNGNALISTAC